MPQSQDVLAPSGTKARFQANLAALRTLAELRESGSPATAKQQATIARFGSWGAVPEVFDERRQDWHSARIELMETLGRDGYEAARRTTLNAHFTDPAIVRPMWESLNVLGLKSGNVLEPGSGMGTFIGLAPSRLQMTGVELDPTTAELSSYLYPDATIRAEGFEGTNLPLNYFDGAIGNVPFGNFKLHDRTHNAGDHAIHNHFIIKSLNLTRGGGLAAFVTSAYTMDSQNPAARREIADMADLVGAVRLPNRAHQRAAGTEVLTDILIFRKRYLEDEPAKDQGDWINTASTRVPAKNERVGELLAANGGSLTINKYFLNNPRNVLGEFVATQGIQGSVQLGVTGGDPADLSTDLEVALGGIIESAQERKLTQGPRRDPVALDEEAIVDAPSIAWDGHIALTENGEFVEYLSGVPHALKVPRTAQAEVRALMGLRDLGTSLLAAEASTTTDTPEVQRLRGELRGAWEQYVSEYGPINRYTESWRASRAKGAEPGEMIMVAMAPTATNVFRRDPFSAFVFGLEKFNTEKQTAQPADILTERALSKRIAPQGAENAYDALNISLDQTGGVDLSLIATLRGQSEEDARAELGALVFEDPAKEGALVTAAEYLSGNVRSKLTQAEEAAADDPGIYTGHIDALRNVIPAPLQPADIEPQPGAAWIPPADHERFLYETLGLRSGQLKFESSGDGQWHVKQTGIRNMFSANTTWGTEDRSAVDLFRARCEQRPIRVERKNADGSSYLDPVATDAANQKAEALTERFQEWVWENPARAERLAAEYNEKFNSIALRDYSSAGKALTFPGMATATFTPMEHQRTAVARILSEPAVGLFHQVGAGKTAEMVMGAMELKRLGMANKPTIVVPNHMLEQFTREFTQIYPKAQLLAAGSQDLEKYARRRFVASAASNDWDCIIMTRGAFERLDIQDEARADYLRTQVAEFRTALNGAGELSTKAIEKQIASMEEKIKKLMDNPSDPGISFEQTGIDYLFIDEAHDYKNLALASNIQEAAKEGSGRATDLHSKLEYLRQTHGDRVATFATGTPIANSVSEAFIMQKYLRPDLLQQAGVREFDAWAATFGKVVDVVEMAPEGDRFRLQQRFAQFQNVPELVRMMHVYADVKMAEDLNLPTPARLPRPDGKQSPDMVTVDASLAVVDYIQGLGDRADLVRAGQVDRTEDNMLAISTDGRKAALSMELVGIEDPEAGSGKIPVAAQRIASIYHQYAETTYTHDSGEQTPGALQLVFADLRQTSSSDYDVYNDLRSRLIEGGVPAGKIQFMQDAKNDKEKAQIFRDARNGNIAVLVGSTQTMGTGTNVQRRAIALHQLDCPWRPADVEQRVGRILRQGNENAAVAELRYATKRSFDAYMWQTVERKEQFISQIMRGSLDMRVIEDVGKNGLDYAEIKAGASGNPLLIEKTALQSDLRRLKRLERAHNAEQQGLRIKIPQLTESLATLKQLAPTLRELHALSTDSSGDKFTATISGATYSERSKAAQALGQWAQNNLARVWPHPDRERDLGVALTVAGHDVHAYLVAERDTTRGEGPIVQLRVPGTTQDNAVQLKAQKLVSQPDHHLIQSIETKIAGYERAADRLETTIENRQHELTEAEKNLGKTFKHGLLLRETQSQLDDVERRMMAREKALKDDPSGPTLDDPGPAAPTGGGEAPESLRVPSTTSHGAAVPAHRQAWRQSAHAKETAYDR